ncbi:hypothetical protein Pan44_02980 [Caulifigura coniformis]|uniref:Uncharacterized protein n=1 Tax=Caulifigura coniformis TaxID=2527983 RepID=A0A517S832_9PLAN|nr:hypothetical protein [Caulifigura coniformis]QDT52289.1 hypothetical protein Pan44_02980 [Caulifigura coniformis]
MVMRLILAALALGIASGCTSVSETPISLVAQKPALNRWPFKRTPPAAKYLDDRSDKHPAGAVIQLPQKRDEFLQSLPADLREQVEAELVGASDEERQRLLAYFATVEPAKLPALLETLRQQRSASQAVEAPKVVTAAAEGKPVFERDDDAIPDRQVEPATAETTATGIVAPPIARPRRNPLIEIQGVEFDDAPEEKLPEVTPATSSSLEGQTEPALEPSFPAPPVAPQPTTPEPVISSPTAPGPLTRLKEWTSIRKPDPATANGEPPVQTAQAPTDPSALSLQGLSRRLRGAPPPRTETASLPVDPLLTVGGSPHLQEGLERLIALMEAETARLKPGTSFTDREEYVRRHAELRMLYLMSRQPTLALQAIPEVDPETQEFWTSLTWSLSNYFDNQSIVDPADRAAATLERLRAAEHYLQTMARLEIRSLEFCDKIDGFGAYHPFEQDVFRPGQPVLLYAEVRNFKTDVTSAGRYRTALKSTIEIIKAGPESELIERRQFESTEDQSRSPRSDYFHSYKLDLPLHLTPGNFTLRLTLEDELSGKIGVSSIEFVVR